MDDLVVMGIVFSTLRYDLSALPKLKCCFDVKVSHTL